MKIQRITSIQPAVTLFNELVSVQLSKLTKMESSNELYEKSLNENVIKLLPKVVEYFSKVEYKITPLNQMLQPSIAHYEKVIVNGREDLIVKMNRIFIGLSISDIPDASINRILKIYDTLFNLQYDINTILSESSIIKDLSTKEI